MTTARLAILSAFIVGAAAGFAAGCQTYDFEPVQPLALSQVTQSRDVAARNLKPNVMLLVDRSGSMDQPTDPSNPNCSLPDGGYCGLSKGSLCNTDPTSPGYCPTRWSELQGAMGDFLTDAGTVARMGVAVFPKIYTASFGSCGLPDNPDGGDAELTLLDISHSSDVDSELQAQAGAILQVLQSITSAQRLLPDGGPDYDHTTGGGTPTGASLRALGNNQVLTDPQRSGFVLLLTDGVPNCNPNNPNTGASPACRCTLANNFCPGFIGGLGCLDRAGTVTEVTNLADAGVRTIVVGFGAETASGDGPGVLDALAKAGGMARSCDGGSSCGPAYYQAANRAELARVLAEIGGRLIANPCIFQLEATPSDPRLLSVLINGTVVQPGADTWMYDAAKNQVVLQGATCAQANATTTSSKMKVEIRIVQGL